MTRVPIAELQRLVVKVGSSSISGDNADQIPALVDSLARLHSNGIEVILVSSGAIATGMPLLNLSERPEDLATQQAAAAVGQSVLVHSYQQEFNRFGIVGAQVLLTAGDMSNSTHKANARQAMERLLGLGVIPIVNENDTVATHEIRFGDNDHLAALVSELVGADALVLLSDTDALYTLPPHEPGAVAVEAVPYGDALSHVTIGAAGSGVGTGGAVTKVAAARLAADAGAHVVLTSTHNFERLVAGDAVGTWFEAARVS